MTDDSSPIKAGDRVAYVLADGALAGSARGVVLGVFRTRDGKTLADVEWTRAGMPKRVSVERLVRA